MQLTVNGKQIEIDSSITISQLLEQLDLANERVAVEHNGQILDSAKFSVIAVSQSDSLEIVRFVGGG